LFGALASIILVVAVVIVGIQDYSSYAGKVSHAFVIWDSLALAMGTLAFSFGGNFVYPEVEHSMKNPDDFPKVLKHGMMLITGKSLKI
jgi:vesicular inhibitory amino acid transporter